MSLNLTKLLANKVAALCEKSVDASPNIYSTLFFGYEISLSVDEEDNDTK